VLSSKLHTHVLPQPLLVGHAAGVAVAGFSVCRLPSEKLQLSCSGLHEAAAANRNRNMCCQVYRRWRQPQASWLQQPSVNNAEAARNPTQVVTVEWGEQLQTKAKCQHPLIDMYLPSIARDIDMPAELLEACPAEIAKTFQRVIDTPIGCET
jgi:hypothetical protein